MKEKKKKKKVRNSVGLKISQTRTIFSNFYQNVARYLKKYTEK